jgi:hypothetical protein
MGISPRDGLSKDEVEGQQVWNVRAILVDFLYFAAP